MTTYIQLENKEIVRMDEKGFIRVPVNVSLADMLNVDFEEFLDLLSTKATGSPLLSDISYKITRMIDGQTVEMMITGDVELINYDEVLEKHLPLVTYNVAVTRISYGQRDIQVQARTREDAMNFADDDAGNHVYDEHYAEYEFGVTKA